MIAAWRTKRGRPLRLLLFVTVLAALLYVILRPSLGQLRSEHAALRERYRQLLRAESALQVAPVAGDAALGIPMPYLRTLIEVIAPRWLSEAQLHIGNFKLREQGVLRKKTLLGQMQLGAWRLDVNIAQVGAVLRAGKPLIETLANDRLQVRLPVTIMRGQGRATVRFRWNAAGIANVVCRDFNVTRRVDGMVMTDSYTLNGDFVLRSADGSILAEPHLNPQTLRVRVRPTKATRLAVRAALSEQNSLLKCGLAMDPDDVMAKLDALLAPGFPVEVPAIALPAVRIPASFRYSMEPRRAAALDLSIQNTALRLSPEYLWLHATIETHRAPALELSAPAGAGPAAQPSF